MRSSKAFRMLSPRVLYVRDLRLRGGIYREFGEYDDPLEQLGGIRVSITSARHL